MIWETPNMRIVKLNEEYLKENGYDDEGFITDAIMRLYDSWTKAYTTCRDKVIHTIMDESGLCYECAEYYMERLMKLDCSMKEVDGCWCYVMEPKWKEVDDLLYEMDNMVVYDTDLSRKCEWELLGFNDWSDNGLYDMTDNYK